MLLEIVSITYGQYGECTRYYDGTQIMRAKQSLSTTVATQWGGLYRSGAKFFADFIQAFSDVPTVTYSVYPTGGSMAFIVKNATIGLTTSNPGSVEIVVGASLTSAKEFTIGYIAVGRWK